MAKEIIEKGILQNLYSGFAIAIDENINEPESGDKIYDIVGQIEKQGIPLVKYDALPTNINFKMNIKAVSFFILDWELNPISVGAHDEDQTDLQLGSAIQDSSFEDNVKFIEMIKDHCFAPIFIFTAYDIETVKNYLLKSKKNLYNQDDESRNFILIRSKKSVSGENSMFDEIEKWINSNPALYSLKVWENSFYKAKNETFWNLFNKSPKWPEVLWNSYEEDMVDPNSNFFETIYRLIISRTEFGNIERDKIFIKDAPIVIEELKEVIKGVMYLENEYLIKDEVRPGDIFKFKTTPGKPAKYWINVRPVCDTITGRSDGKVYLLKGNKLSTAECKKHFLNRYNPKAGIMEQHNEAAFYGIDDNDFVLFKFNEIVIKDFNELMKESNRICRLMPPFVTYVQQKYAAYTSRTGLPRFPYQVMKEIIPMAD